jgi:phosphopantothenoylcysteine decarboxylase/phosphopantothenate--cysteine ligase
MRDARILLIIGGGIAAYKSLTLIRRLREKGARVRPLMTRGAQAFVTPLSVGALAESAVMTDLLDLTQEQEIGHIRASREADLVLVAPATADLIARFAQGRADDLAGAVYLACDKTVILCPAMNPFMWRHPATRRNVAQLLQDGVRLIGPETGEMAERGEAGLGRMSEPEAIVAALESHFIGAETAGALAGTRVLVTAGPTHEPIDPVRYIANRSSGRQGYAIAAAAAKAGAQVVLVSGPVDLAAPPGIETVRVETARDMRAAVEAHLPVDAAIMAAAVADWRVADEGAQKMKKGAGGPPALTLVENPDILATLARHPAHRPRLVVGFAAETENLIPNARAKLQKKGCDWIVANDVSPTTGVMGGAENTVHLVTAEGVEDWPRGSKDAVAERLVARIAAALPSRAEGAE